VAKAVRKRKGQQGKKRAVSAEEAEGMFALYCTIKETKGISGVAQFFRRARSTVNDIARKYKWAQRYKKVQQQVQATTEKETAKRQIEKQRMADAVISATYEKLFEKDDKTGEKLLVTEPSVRDFLHASEYGDKLREKFPDTGTDERCSLPEDIVLKAVKYLQGLGKKGLKKLGDWLPDHVKHPDEQNDEQEQAAS